MAAKPVAAQAWARRKGAKDAKRGESSFAEVLRRQRLLHPPPIGLLATIVFPTPRHDLVTGYSPERVDLG
jgi:hypothetical protein